MAQLVVVLDLRTLDEQVAVFSHPDGVVTARMDRAEWEKDGRPTTRYAVLTSVHGAAMQMLRVDETEHQ